MSTLASRELGLERAQGIPELFQEGVKRLKDARALLEESELTVKKVLEAADGTLRIDDLDD